VDCPLRGGLGVQFRCPGSITRTRKTIGDTRLKSEVQISGNRVTITRTFNAPRHIVFGYWTKADKLQQWSGCKGATKCEIEMDFRVGGTFTQKMQIAGAGEFSFSGI
jgi:Activator of Hsp90 ATPase homolog 1-like protein